MANPNGRPGEGTATMEAWLFEAFDELKRLMDQAGSRRGSSVPFEAAVVTFAAILQSSPTRDAAMAVARHLHACVSQRMEKAGLYEKYGVRPLGR